eukprot:PITA_13908
MVARYIIIVIEYLTRWIEAPPVKDCTGTTAMKFLFENVLNRFSYSKILMSDRGTHFLNEMINTLTEEFQVYHQKRTPYHPQANGMMEAFNKVLENALTKVCNTQRSDWDLLIPTVLWAHRTTCKKLTGQTPFRLVYGVEAVAQSVHKDTHRMDWLGPYVIMEITDGGAVQLAKLNGEPFLGKVIEEACRMVPELAILEEEPVEVRTCKLAIGVHDTQTKMARVLLDLNLQITKLQLKAKPSTPAKVKD